jgi:hypothetical protein
MSFFDTDEIYDKQFNTTYKFIRSGLSGKLDEDIKTLESTIKTLFDYQGLDWIGRGDLFLVKNQATIAATETVLYELKEQS